MVQFVVWGSFSNIVGRPVFQGTNTFVNPSWYYPVDLNPVDANGNYLTPTNWSPYYFVYSCPPGSVWINEFNYVVDELTENGYEYVELCGRAGIDISNWKIDAIDPFTSLTVPYREAVVPANQQMPEWYSPVYGSLQTDGWGFYVWGGTYVAYRNPGPADQYGPYAGAQHLV